MKPKATIVLALIIVFAPMGVLAEKKTPLRLHHFELPCENCHEPQQTVSNRQTTANADFRPIKGSINRLCTSSGCHDFDPMFSHPVDVSYKGTIPADMPLEGNSNITCLTCHNEPKPVAEQGYADVGMDRMLRKPGGIRFCGGCHMKMGGTLQKQAHWQFSLKAHLKPTDLQLPSLKNNSTQLIGGLDSESFMCASCHDDIAVTIPVLNETTAQKKQRWKSMSSHSIGMDYQNVAMRRARRYKFPLTDNGPIRLFDGRVGCGSCHSLYAKTENYLVETYDRGVLCKKCHDMP